MERENTEKSSAGGGGLIGLSVLGQTAEATPRGNGQFGDSIAIKDTQRSNVEPGAAAQRAGAAVRAGVCYLATVRQTTHQGRHGGWPFSLHHWVRQIDLLVFFFPSLSLLFFFFFYYSVLKSVPP